MPIHSVNVCEDLVINGLAYLNNFALWCTSVYMLEQKFAMRITEIGYRMITNLITKIVLFLSGLLNSHDQCKM